MIEKEGRFLIVYIGWSPIELALFYCNFDAAKELVKLGITIDKELLYWAINEQPFAIDFILKNGAGVQEKINGLTPLCHSLFMRRKEAKNILIERKAKLEVSDAFHLGIITRRDGTKFDESFFDEEKSYIEYLKKI